jgi:membrane-associated phospholipid phosphatase
LVAIQSALAERPGALGAARVLSHFGEHSIGWLAVSAVGAILHPQRSRAWLLAGAGAFAAHATAVLIKRLVRRPRPHHPAVTVNVDTPSRLSFPSAHATSTTAAAILLARVTGAPLPAMLVPPMALSRVLLGVHYPSDVATGMAVGAAIAAIAVRVDSRLLGDDAGRDGRNGLRRGHAPRGWGHIPLAGEYPHPVAGEMRAIIGGNRRRGP